MDTNNIFILIGLLIISLSFCNNNTNSQNNIFTAIYLILIIGIIFNLMNKESLIKNTGIVRDENQEDFDNIADTNIDNEINYENNENNADEDLTSVNNTCNTKMLNPSDLLPNNDDLFDITNQNFLNYDSSVGAQTGSLRNANLQLRSEPPNPQVKVSPWLQTTIGPDLTRRPLEDYGCTEK